MIEFVYLQRILNDPVEISKRAILSATNKHIDQINNTILDQKIEGNEIVLYSADSAVIDKDTNPDNKHITADMLNKVKKGVPNQAHCLHLLPTYF